MNKFFVKLNILFLLISILVHPAYSQDTENDILTEKINTIGFNKLLCLDPKADIQRFIDKHNKYATDHNLEKLKSLYTDSYVNTDGFDKETYFKMIQKTWDLYPNVLYSMQIKEVSIKDDYATVQVIETAVGTTKESFENIKENGAIESTSYTLYYLQKFGRDWKITSNNILEENTSLKYGDAKDINIRLNAPTQVKGGQDYTTTMNIDVPSNTFVLASLSNEPIIYPQVQPKDVFRNVRKNGVLERVFTANKDEYNEYAIASVGITKASIVNSQNISINVTGMAFLMTRINVLNVKENKYKTADEALNLDNGKI